MSGRGGFGWGEGWRGRVYAGMQFVTACLTECSVFGSCQCRLSHAARHVDTTAA